jgi:hypothetical protein
VLSVSEESTNGLKKYGTLENKFGKISKLRPKINEMPITNVFFVSMPELRIICIADIIIKHVTKISIAPITGMGITDKRPEIFGKKPSIINNPPAMYPMTRLVAPDALLKATLLADVSEATPPNNPDTVTHIESAVKPLAILFMSGSFHSSSLTFSHIIRLPKDFNAPVIETIINTGTRDHLNASRKLFFKNGDDTHGELATL